MWDRRGAYRVLVERSDENRPLGRPQRRRKDNIKKYSRSGTGLLWLRMGTDSGIISFTNCNAQFLYSLTICMLHYNPRHVSSNNMPIFRMTNFIITASGIVTLCKRLYSMPDESRLIIQYDARSKKHKKR